jgi:small subunit ribosomal protein S17
MIKMVNTENTGTVKRGHRKERVGTVVSDCQEKTIVVQVERRIAHPLYKKVVKTSKKYVTDDQANVAKIGDKVRIIETRPLSKTKRWRLLEIIKKAE